MRSPPHDGQVSPKRLSEGGALSKGHRRSRSDPTHFPSVGSLGGTGKVIRFPHKRHNSTSADVLFEENGGQGSNLLSHLNPPQLKEIAFMALGKESNNSNRGASCELPCPDERTDVDTVPDVTPPHSRGGWTIHGQALKHQVLGSPDDSSTLVGSFCLPNSQGDAISPAEHISTVDPMHLQRELSDTSLHAKLARYREADPQSEAADLLRIFGPDLPRQASTRSIGCLGGRERQWVLESHKSFSGYPSMSVGAPILLSLADVTGVDLAQMLLSSNVSMYFDADAQRWVGQAADEVDLSGFEGHSFRAESHDGDDDQYMDDTRAGRESGGGSGVRSLDSSSDFELELDGVHHSHSPLAVPPSPAFNAPSLPTATDSPHEEDASLRRRSLSYGGLGSGSGLAGKDDNVWDLDWDSGLEGELNFSLVMGSNGAYKLPITPIRSNPSSSPPGKRTSPGCGIASANSSAHSRSKSCNDGCNEATFMRRECLTPSKPMGDVYKTNLGHITLNDLAHARGSIDGDLVEDDPLLAAAAVAAAAVVWEGAESPSLSRISPFVSSSGLPGLEKLQSITKAGGGNAAGQAWFNPVTMSWEGFEDPDMAGFSSCSEHSDGDPEEDRLGHSVPQKVFESSDPRAPHDVWQESQEDWDADFEPSIGNLPLHLHPRGDVLRSMVVSDRHPHGKLQTVTKQDYVAMQSTAMQGINALFDEYRGTWEPTDGFQVHLSAFDTADSKSIHKERRSTSAPANRRGSAPINSQGNSSQVSSAFELGPSMMRFFMACEKRHNEAMLAFMGPHALEKAKKEDSALLALRTSVACGATGGWRRKLRARGHSSGSGGAIRISPTAKVSPRSPSRRRYSSRSGCDASQSSDSEGDAAYTPFSRTRRWQSPSPGGNRRDTNSSPDASSSLLRGRQRSKSGACGTDVPSSFGCADAAVATPGSPSCPAPKTPSSPVLRPSALILSKPSSSKCARPGLKEFQAGGPVRATHSVVKAERTSPRSSLGGRNAQNTPTRRISCDEALDLEKEQVDERAAGQEDKCKRAQRLKHQLKSLSSTQVFLGILKMQQVQANINLSSEV
jgi:hypothetical protein